jgi:hypothetical protein
MKKRFTISIMIFLLASVFLTGTQALARTYVTNFPLTEDPISEGGNWVNGGTTGLDWVDVSTESGYAHGNYSPSFPRYKDPTAILTGTWGPNQTVQGTVVCNNPNDRYYQEVELRLRSAISAHSNTGYELLFRCSKTLGEAYAQIVRWNGALGDFTYVGSCGLGTSCGVVTGDAVKATIVGSTIKGYINNVEVMSATDSTYATGNPGMGFDYGCGDTNVDFGFTAFMATDGRLDLSSGWNFVSFPSLPQAGGTIAAVFGDASTALKVIWGYDNQNKLWKRWKPGAVSNTLSTIETGKGYWVYMDTAASIDRTGWLSPPSTGVHLYEGWNLIGYLGSDNASTGAALGSISNKWSVVWGWENGAWSAKHETILAFPAPIQPLANFRTGSAYWIRTKTATDWEQ